MSHGYFARPRVVSSLALACALGAAACTKPQVIIEASGVHRTGNHLLIVSDDDAGAIYRVPLSGKSGLSIAIDFKRVARQSIPNGAVITDIEAVDRMDEHRVVVLSEDRHALFDEYGALVAQYDDSFQEIGNAGLEGLAVRMNTQGDAYIAVVWEGGYLNDMPGEPARPPLLVTHTAGYREENIRVPVTAQDAVKLQVPAPAGAEPAAQRFRVPAIAWHKGSRDSEWLLIALLSSGRGDGKREYRYKYLQRYRIDGTPVGDPFDLATMWDPAQVAKNWEGLGWYIPGKSLVLIYDTRRTRDGLTAAIVPLPDSWR